MLPIWMNSSRWEEIKSLSAILNKLRAVVSDDAIVFDVSDQGPDFDMDKKRVEPTPETVTREEGRGLFLMHRLMDRVEHIRKNGNIIRLTLRRE